MGAIHEVQISESKGVGVVESQVLQDILAFKVCASLNFELGGLECIRAETSARNIGHAVSIRHSTRKRKQITILAERRKCSLTSQQTMQAPAVPSVQTAWRQNCPAPREQAPCQCCSRRHGACLHGCDLSLGTQ
jgi:hypothetical protein